MGIESAVEGLNDREDEVVRAGGRSVGAYASGGRRKRRLKGVVLLAQVEQHCRSRVM